MSDRTDSIISLLLSPLPSNQHRQVYITRSDRKNSTALIHACRNGHTAVASILLSALDTDEARLKYLRSTTVYITTAFMDACLNCHIETATFLMSYLPPEERRAFIFQKDFYGQNSLMLSCKGEHSTVTSFLLDSLDSEQAREKLVLEKDNYGSTALIQLCNLQSPNIALISLLILTLKLESDRCAYILHMRHNGDTAFSLACQKGDVDTATFFLDLLHVYNPLASLNCILFEDLNGVTALMQACRYDRTAIVSLLFDRLSHQDKNSQELSTDLTCPSPSSSTIQNYILHQSHNGDCALTITCRKGFVSCFTLLLESLAESTRISTLLQRNRNGKTALQIACQHKYSEIVTVLLKHLTDDDIRQQCILIKGNLGQTAIMIASSYGLTEILSALLESLPTMQSRLESLLDKSENGFTALMSAASGGFTETSALILSHFSSVEQKEVYIMHEETVDGYNTLGVACMSNGDAMVRHLLENLSTDHLRQSFILHVSESTRKTALIAACTLGKPSIVKLLLESIPDPAIREQYILCESIHGRTALHYACDVEESPQIVQLLLDALSSDKVRQNCILHMTSDGQNALRQACSLDRVPTIAILLHSLCTLPIPHSIESTNMLSKSLRDAVSNQDDEYLVAQLLHALPLPNPLTHSILHNDMSTQFSRYFECSAGLGCGPNYVLESIKLHGLLCILTDLCLKSYDAFQVVQLMIMRHTPETLVLPCMKAWCELLILVRPWIVNRYVPHELGNNVDPDLGMEMGPMVGVGLGVGVGLMGGRIGMLDNMGSMDVTIGRGGGDVGREITSRFPSAGLTNSVPRGSQSSSSSSSTTATAELAQTALDHAFVKFLTAALDYHDIANPSHLAIMPSSSASHNEVSLLSSSSSSRHSELTPLSSSSSEHANTSPEEHQDTTTATENTESLPPNPRPTADLEDHLPSPPSAPLLASSRRKVNMYDLFWGSDLPSVLDILPDGYICQLAPNPYEQYDIWVTHALSRMNIR